MKRNHGYLFDMKYVISESQFEILTESQEYMNFLLDKMNTSGYESLTDREKDALVRISKGEEVYDEPQELPVSDDVYRPNDMFLKYATGYDEIEVDDLIFKISPMEGTSSFEVLGKYHSFLVEPNFEENQVQIYDMETDEITPIRYKNVPETTEGMRKLAVKFVYQTLPAFIRKNIQ